MSYLPRFGQVACLVVLASASISLAQYPQTAQPYTPNLGTSSVGMPGSSGQSGFAAIPPHYSPPYTPTKSDYSASQYSSNQYSSNQYSSDQTPGSDYANRTYSNPHPTTSRPAANYDTGDFTYPTTSPTAPYSPPPTGTTSGFSNSYTGPAGRAALTPNGYGPDADYGQPSTPSYPPAGRSFGTQSAPPATNPAVELTDVMTTQPQESPSDLPTPDPPEEMEYEDIPIEEEAWGITQWLTPVDWDKGLEVGLNGTKGNADQLSLRAGFNLKRKTDKNETIANLTYNKAQADDVETKHNALLNLGYEHFLGESPWTLFTKTGLEYDEFRAFDLRYFFNGGVGYQLIRNEHDTLKTRFGAGASKEFDSPDDEWKPESSFGLDYDAQVTERQKVTATLDYFPAWNDFSDFRYVSQIAWELLLSEEHDLSLKLSVNDRYDSTPSGLKPNDIDYALLLLWSM